MTAGDSDAAAPPRRLRLLLSVAAVVLVLDIVTKVLAVELLTPDSRCRSSATPSPGRWCAIPGRRSRWRRDTPGC
ncbi:putative lipoprotein signal peptidase [Mycobacterium xenopi 3993]|nr:putative lipoprotein signal peptidase [Mycobacterium xenopi 3993]